MAIAKVNLETLFDRCLSFEEEAKTQRGLLKEALQTFADQNEIKVKSLKKSYREYKEMLKDKAEFSVVDAEVDQLVTLLIEETTTTEEGE